jgi:DnaJ domain
MQPTALEAGSSRQGLGAALLDYSRSPGKYQVAQRQPPALFVALRDVLQIAVGREGDAGADEAAGLHDPARFFIRTALLYPGADHYALLGLERNAGNADLKDRYRLMMRLLHPDFSGPTAGAWPPDSAVRVNKAYEVLSSAVQRREYDASLGPLPMPVLTSSAGARGAGAVPAQVVPKTRESSFRKLALACALAGAVFVVLMLFAGGASETNQLVQRVPVEPTPTRLALQEEAPLILMPDPSTGPQRLPEAPVQVQSHTRTVPHAAAKDSKPTLAAAAPTAALIGRAAAPVPATMVAAQAPVRAVPGLETPPARPSFVSTQTSPGTTSPASIPVEHKLESQAPVTVTSAVAQPSPSLAAPAPAAIQTQQAQRPAWKAAPTLMDVQPLLSQLLQLLESGRGERILNMLDVEARRNPSAQALSRQYDSVVDGARPVRLLHVEFKAEPADGRLLVVGHFRVLAGEQTIGALGKKMALRAEFASRDGTVVITGLSGGPVN